MEGTTHRQFRLWELWLEADENEPGKTEKYLMALRMEVRGLFKECKFEDMRLKFERQQQTIPWIPKEGEPDGKLYITKERVERWKAIQSKAFLEHNLKVKK